VSTATLTQTPADLAREAADLVRQALGQTSDLAAQRQTLREARNVVAELSTVVQRAAFNAFHRTIVGHVNSAMHEAALSEGAGRRNALIAAIYFLERIAPSSTRSA
jgi:hypothetical protein